MRILSKILRVITFIVVALFICGIDSIYDNNQMIAWLLVISILSILTYKLQKNVHN